MVRACHADWLVACANHMCSPPAHTLRRMLLQCAQPAVPSTDGGAWLESDDDDAGSAAHPGDVAPYTPPPGSPPPDTPVPAEPTQPTVTGEAI
jgi:hypothetical protein